MAAVLALLGAGRVSADTVFASFDPADATSDTGSLDGVSFTITGLSSPDVGTADLSGGSFSAAPGGSSEPGLAYYEQSIFTVTFASPIADLYLYDYYWRPESGVTYAFTQPISILSGNSIATVEGGTNFVSPYSSDFLNGIIELTNVSSFTVTPSVSDATYQELAFATPVPEPGTFGLLAMGASCLLFVRRCAGRLAKPC